MLKTFKYTLLSIVVIAGVFLLLPSSLSQEKNIVIPRGSTMSVAECLAREGVISNKYSFWFLAQASKALGYKIKSGEYLFKPNQTLLLTLKKMISGDVIMRKITFPEGYTNEQIFNLIRLEPALKGDIVKGYIEGSLLPETYIFTYGDTRQGLVDKMYNSMGKEIKNLWVKRDIRIDALIKNASDALNLASIVEKEAKHQDEREKIASVFLNRLKKKMKLQADPTTIYAITLGKYALGRPLYYKDLAVASPFNTYYAYGLPPTAIANPGLKSIKAVLNPIESDYLYFVIQDCAGRHAFSSNIKEHEKNVQVFRKLKCN